jgi:AcrR family transcriptional regulator
LAPVGNRPQRPVPAKAGQRQRLVAGMTQAAARYGYREASVARVVEQAGVSRATFYEHFADKEACFLAAFEQAAERLELALERIDGSKPAQRAPELLNDLVENVVQDPAAARILLMEARAGGPLVRQAHEELTVRVAAILEAWLRQPEDDGYRMAITGRAIMEGAVGILVIRVFRRETAHLAALRGDLVAWMNSYAARDDRAQLRPERWRELGAVFVVPQGDRRGGRASRRLPRGRTAAAPEAVTGRHRERILAAMNQLARTKGYTAMTVADIVKAAAVTREAFYELFRSKEDAFLAAQTAGLEASISTTAAKFFAGENWPARAWDGLEALLGYVALWPDLVYLDVIESYAVGAAAIRRSIDNLMAYTLFFEDGYRQGPQAERLPRLCSEAIAASVLGLMRRTVDEGRTERMLEILPQAGYVALAPFIGPTAAMEFIEAKVAAAGAATA